MMQAVGILSLCMAEVDRGTERWTMSHDSSEKGKGEDIPPLAGVKTTQLSSRAAEGRCLADRQCRGKGGLTSCPQHDGHLVNLATPTS